MFDKAEGEKEGISLQFLVLCDLGILDKQTFLIRNEEKMSPILDLR